MLRNRCPRVSIWPMRNWRPIIRARALETLDGAQQSQKNTLRYLLVYNWALIAAGKGDEARRGVASALSVAKTPEALLQDGLLKLAKQDFAGSRAALEQALNAVPGRSAAVDAAGAVLRGSETDSCRHGENPPGGCEAAQIAGACRCTMRRWLLQNGQRQEAVQAAAAAAAADPKSSAPPMLLALLNLSDGKLDDAHGGVDRRCWPKNRATWMPTCRWRWWKMPPASTMRRWKSTRRVLTLDSAHVGALNNLAYDLARDSARCDEALSYAQKAKELAPGAWEIQDTLGWIYYRKGLFDFAAREFEGPQSKGAGALARLHLGMTYNRLGNVGQGGTAGRCRNRRRPQAGRGEPHTVVGPQVISPFRASASLIPPSGIPYNEFRLATLVGGSPEIENQWTYGPVTKGQTNCNV